MTDQVAGTSGANIGADKATATDGAKFNEAVQSQNNNQSGGSYTVKKGDTLWGISKKFFRKGINYTDIQSANNMGKSTKIKPGMTLTIPLPNDFGNVKPKLADTPKITTQAPERNVQSPVPHTVIAPDSSVIIEPKQPNISAAPPLNAQQPKGIVDGFKDKLLEGVDSVKDMLKGASNVDAAALMGKIAKGVIPDAGLVAVKFEFAGEPVLVAELVPTPKKGLENWSAGNSTTFIAYKDRVYTMTPNGVVETGKPIFKPSPASEMFPALKNNKIAKKTILFGNDRSGLDLDGAVSPKFNLRSRNLGAIWALNDPAAKADAKRQNLAEKAIDVLVADKMAPLEAAETASDAAAVAFAVGTLGAGTPEAIAKKAVTKTGLYFAKKGIIKDVKKTIKDVIKQGATWYAGVAYRANVQVDPKSNDPLKLQTPAFTVEGDPIPDAAKDYIMQRVGGSF